MRTEAEIVQERDALTAEYHEKSPGMTMAAASAMRLKIRAVKHELSATLAAGAATCPNCGATPMGMNRGERKIPGTDTSICIYEVGCSVCAPVLTDDGKRRRRYSAQGATPTAAVTNWNAAKFVEDAHIDRIP